MRRVLGVLAIAVLVVACGDDEPAKVAAGGGDDGVLYEADTTVLESPEHGPELCLGGVATSLPPQCGGVPVTNWDWEAVDHEDLNGTRWGSYHVVGTYDGETFTLTEAAGPSRPQTSEPVEFPTPCPEPEGGWPGGADEMAIGDLNAWAEGQDGFAGLWIGRPGGTVVANVRVTGDVEGWERRIGEQGYDGPLCLDVFEHAHADLRRIQDELTAEHAGRMTMSSVDVVGNHVDLEVHAVEPGEQDALDARYGEGVVRITGALRPVP